MGGRFKKARGYYHAVRYIGGGLYRISWQWDRYYAGSRIRYPQSCHRITDKEGAERFAKKWGVYIRSS